MALLPNAVAASAIELIEAKTIRPLGTQAEVYLPGTGAELTLDRLMCILRRKAGKGCHEAWKMVHDAIADGQDEPEMAWALYALACSGKQQDPVALERLHARLIEAQVPPEVLPHEESDGLSALLTPPPTRGAIWTTLAATIPRENDGAMRSISA